MNVATVSSKYQISLPKEIREKIGLKVGQQFIFIPKRRNLYLVMKISLKEARGILQGANAENIRDRKDRF